MDNIDLDIIMSRIESALATCAREDVARDIDKLFLAYLMKAATRSEDLGDINLPDHMCPQIREAIEFLCRMKMTRFDVMYVHTGGVHGLKGLVRKKFAEYQAANDYPADHV